MSETTTSETIDLQNLGPWVQQAWSRHDTQAQALLDALAAHAAQLPDAPEGADALRLAEHVALAHLDGAAALAALLDAVPPHASLVPMLERSRWVLAVIDGREAPEPPEGTRWRALQNLVLGLARTRQFDTAAQVLLADEARAAAIEPASAGQAYAAAANNVALGLRVGPRGDAAVDALMLQAAALSRRAWAVAGTWLEVERAEYQLAMCHAAAGQGAAAQAHAAACIAACEAQGADAAERFFAHECAVHAARAAGDGPGAAAHREAMVTLLQQVTDAAMRPWCEETLAAL